MCYVPAWSEQTKITEAYSSDCGKLQMSATVFHIEQSDPTGHVLIIINHLNRTDYSFG